MSCSIGERHGGQHQEHGQRHEHGAGEAEPDPGQDQRQGRLRHPEGQDGQREGRRALQIDPVDSNATAYHYYFYFYICSRSLLAAIILSISFYPA